MGSQPYAPETWCTWLVPLIFLVCIFMFGYTMYINDCPETTGPENLRIGPLYVLSGFGGSLMSCLCQETRKETISVGASGALFGLLGAMLSDLITNWTIYTRKCVAFALLGIVIALNLAVGFIPGVDNSAHLGGFISGFLLGFIFLLRPQYGYVSSKYIAAGYDIKHRKPKYKFYQKLLWVAALVTFVIGSLSGLTEIYSVKTIEG